MTKPLSMTPAAVRSRAYRETMKSSRDRARAARPIKKPPAPSVRKRRAVPILGTVFQAHSYDVGRPTTMRQRIRDLAVAHMIRTSGKDLGYRERQALLKSFDAELAALDKTEPVKGHSPWNDGLSHAMKEIGPDNDTAHGVLHGPYPTADDIKKAEEDGFIDTAVQLREDHRSEVVSGMKAQRAAPKMYPAVEQPPLYSAVSQDAAKMRECLAECAKVIADAIVHGAKIIAGSEAEIEAIFSGDKDSETWNQVGPGTPLGAWLETAQIVTHLNGNTTTMGFNTCMCRILSLGDAPEWVEKHGGRTTVTHSTFAPPTHWRWPAK